ncbi:MAG TPA: hypothetical protein VIV11_02445 [Kofleriaceae bacterium]
MKRALVVLLILAMASPAHADDRDKWKVLFGASLTLTLGGVLMMVDSHRELRAVIDEQCMHGLVRPDCPTPTGPLPDGFDKEESDRRGDRAALRSWIGGGVTLGAVILGGVSLYKGFLAKPKREPAVVVAPTVTRDGAGAALSLRW